MNNTFYVNNLREAGDLSELEEMFSLVGDVQSQRLVAHEHESRAAGVGVFEMASEQQAVDCIERFHGVSALGQTLSVTAKKPAPRPTVTPLPVKRRASR